MKGGIRIKQPYFKAPINLLMLSLVVSTHFLGFCGIYLAIIGITKTKTILYHFILGYIGIIGSLTGAHRLWSHRSYEVNRILELILVVIETYSGHLSIYKWVRDHRVHHKFVDTDADPYNIKRGLFFSQIGWIMMELTQEYKEKAYMPCYFWNENYIISLCTLLMAYIVVLLQVGTINSISHYYGWRPYDINIESTFNRLVTYLTLGEGYHNFHHTFPEDYSQSELKWTQNFNISSLLIDAWEYMGWVSNKKVVQTKIVKKRRGRTGDARVTIKPHYVLIDQIMGVVTFTWSLWLIFLIRMTYF